MPKGFVDAKKVAEAVLEAIQLDKNDYRLGSTKVYNDIRFNTERISVKQILNIFSLFYFDRNFFLNINLECQLKRHNKNIFKKINTKAKV